MEAIAEKRYLCSGCKDEDILDCEMKLGAKLGASSEESVQRKANIASRVLSY